VFLSVSCSKGTDSASTTKSVEYTVQKGNISLTVTGTGNLAYSNTTDLAFEIAGTVESVSVEAGDSVTEGQELVKLDTSEWDKQVQTLEKALVAAQRNLTTQTNNIERAERNITTKETAINTAERQVSSRELAVRQAELDVQSAQDNLSLIDDVKIAQDAIDEAQKEYDFAESMYQAALVQTVANLDVDYWKIQVTYYKQIIAAAEVKLAEILAGTNVNVTTDVALQVEKSQLQIEQSKRALEDARIAVTDAQSAIEDAKLAVEDANTAMDNARLDKSDAEEAVADAQSTLDEARSLSPVIKAPYTGFITRVNVSGGDEVFKGTVAMQIADPDQFQADIQVTEQDIFSVTLGGDAVVSVDALSNVNFPANITAIAPVATVSQGVVSYKVTVKLTSLQPATGNQSAQSSAIGALPTGTPPAPSSAGSSSSNTASSISLKSGYTTTVEIIIQQQTGVIIVPTKSITRQGQNSTIQVVNGTATETRIVQTGMSDESNTEITSGLSEGEKIVYTRTSSSSSSSTTNSPQQGIIGGFEGGMGGPGAPGG